jgi:glycerol-3-phosphate dehydrogenase (NAD(P)+)
MARVAILGDGGWGTALGLTLHRNGHRVCLWGPFPETIAAIRVRGENIDYLPGVVLPPGLQWTADRAEAVAGAEVVVLASPTKFMRTVLGSFAGLIPSSALLVSVAKGLDAGSHRRMTEVAEEVLGLGPVAALSGPSFASEVAVGAPTAVVIACRDHDRAVKLQAVFNSRRFRVYSSDDVVGVELGGCLKNVMAVATGVCAGIGFGCNAQAALITRGLAEMTRLGVAMGAHPATFAGLSGMGDLVLTCTSRLSRNYTVGERIGRGEALAAILGGMKQVAEGITNAATARELAELRGVSAPIIEEVHAMVSGGKEPQAAVESLLAREPRPERDG